MRAALGATRFEPVGGVEIARGTREDAGRRLPEGTVSSTRHYKSNLRDIYFNLFEALEIQHTTLGKKPFGSLDEETTREALTAYEVLATRELADSFAEADRV